MTDRPLGRSLTVAVSLSVALPWLPSIDWPAWLTAVGTVGAFAVALYLLAVQIRDRGRDATDRRLAQARLVFAWWTGDGAEMPAEGSEHFVLPVIVRNGSTEPVYQVVVNLPVGVRGTFVRNIYTLGPFETRRLDIASPGFPSGMPAPSILFTDSAGKVWLRDADGRLDNPTDKQVAAHCRQDPGAYENQPTLNIANSPSESRGAAVRWPPES